MIRPRPANATSIPAILKMLQDEWDSLMLHSSTLRSQLQKARQELSHALYQHDAACRVIARLNKEVTAAREALATLKPQAGIATGHIQTTADAETAAAARPIEQTGMTAAIVEKLQAKASVLTEERRSRGRTYVPQDLTTADQIKDFKMLESTAVSIEFFLRCDFPI